jgi:hypothetical protein
MMESGVPLCNSCGEQVGVGANGDVFVACHECNFSICRACVDFELKEGRKACLRCAAPYDGISLTLKFYCRFVQTYDSCMYKSLLDKTPRHVNI